MKRWSLYSNGDKKQLIFIVARNYFKFLKRHKLQSNFTE